MYQEIFESQYNGLCDIYEYRTIKDPVTKLTSTELVKVKESLKCRLLFKSFPEAKDGVVNTVGQVVKLLISPSVEIKEGSYLVVTQNEVTDYFENSGKPAVYKYHQEINLKAVDKFA